MSRLLFRFYDVLGGAVKVNGVDVRSLKQKSLRGNIGVVPQNTSLFNDTLKNNIKYGRQDASDEEVLQVIKGLADEGRTMILVTHEMRFAREVASHVIYLHNGVIEEEGPPEDLFGAPKSDRLKQFLKTVG